MTSKHPSEQGWQTLQSIDKTSWIHAREQCHWAMQLVAAVGYAHMERAADDGQSNAGWVDGMQILAGRMVDADPAWFVSLRPSALEVAVHDPDGTAREVMELNGCTLAESFQRLSSSIARLGGQVEVPLELPEYEMPPHALVSGGRFEFAPIETFAELGRWMHDANLVLLDLHKQTPNSTAPRVWPHHFDLGMLISLEEDGDPARGKSIGVGLSPGDAAKPQPYWYVNPYPAPEGELAELSVGRWHREGWTGAVLDAGEVSSVGEDGAQERMVRGFLEEAVEMAGQAL